MVIASETRPCLPRHLSGGNAQADPDGLRQTCRLRGWHASRLIERDLNGWYEATAGAPSMHVGEIPLGYP